MQKKSWKWLAIGLATAIIGNGVVYADEADNGNSTQVSQTPMTGWSVINGNLIVPRSQYITAMTSDGESALYLSIANATQGTQIISSMYAYNLSSESPNWAQIGTLSSAFIRNLQFNQNLYALSQSVESAGLPRSQNLLYTYVNESWSSYPAYESLYSTDAAGAIAVSNGNIYLDMLGLNSLLTRATTNFSESWTTDNTQLNPNGLSTINNNLYTVLTDGPSQYNLSVMNLSQNTQIGESFVWTDKTALLLDTYVLGESSPLFISILSDNGASSGQDIYKLVDQGHVWVKAFPTLHGTTVLSSSPVLSTSGTLFTAYVTANMIHVMQSVDDGNNKYHWQDIGHMTVNQAGSYFYSLAYVPNYGLYLVCKGSNGANLVLHYNTNV